MDLHPGWAMFSSGLAGRRVRMLVHTPYACQVCMLDHVEQPACVCWMEMLGLNSSVATN